MVAMATRVRFRDVSISKFHHGGIFLHCAKFHAFMTKSTIFSHSAWTNRAMGVIELRYRI